MFEQNPSFSNQESCSEPNHLKLEVKNKMKKWVIGLQGFINYFFVVQKN